MTFVMYSHTQRADNINVLKYSEYQTSIDVNIRGGFDPLAPVVPNIPLDLTQFKPFTHMAYEYNGIVWVATVDTVYQVSSSLYSITGTVNPAATCVHSNTLSNSLLYIEYGDYEHSIKSLLPTTTVPCHSASKVELTLDIFPSTIWFAVHMASVVSDYRTNPVTGDIVYSNVKTLGASGDVYIMNAKTLMALQLAFYTMPVEDVKIYSESIDYIEVVRGVGGSDVAAHATPTTTVKLQATYDRGGIYQTQLALVNKVIDLSAVSGRALYLLTDTPGYSGDVKQSFDNTWHKYNFDVSENPIGVKDYSSNISIDYGGLVKLNYTVADSGSTKLSEGGVFASVGFAYRFDWVTSTFYAVPVVDDEPIYTKMVSSSSTERLPWLAFGSLTVSKLSNEAKVIAANVSGATGLVSGGTSLLGGDIVGGIGKLSTGLVSGLINDLTTTTALTTSYLNSAALNNNVSSVGGSPNSVLDDTIRLIMYQVNADINRSAATLTTGYPSNIIYRGIDELTESVYQCRSFVYKPITDSKYTYPAEFVTRLTNQLTSPFFYIP